MCYIKNGEELLPALFIYVLWLWSISFNGGSLDVSGKYTPMNISFCLTWTLFIHDIVRETFFYWSPFVSVVAYVRPMWMPTSINYMEFYSLDMRHLLRTQYILLPLISINKFLFLHAFQHCKASFLLFFVSLSLTCFQLLFLPFSFSKRNLNINNSVMAIYTKF